MHDIDFLLLESTLIHINIIEERFEKIEKGSDFKDTEQGKILLDAITARLQALGENVKKLIKNNPEFENNFPEVNWSEIVRFRDMISHHYDLLDYEVVYAI